jgi:hypothetical protein
MSQIVRSILVLAVGGAALAFAADRFVNSSGFRFPKDFLEYWAAGRLNLRGENPYDPRLLLEEQRIADAGSTDALMMWNPPPSLAVYMPLGWLSAKGASLVWGGIQFFAVMLACDLLWRTYAPKRSRWLGALVGLASVGTWWVVAFGQNAGLLALGLAGFLHFTRKGKPLAAGGVAALTSLKPHLLAGFGVLLLADVFTRRGAISLAAGVSVIAGLLGVALAANPHVVDQFAAATLNPAPGAIPLHVWKLPVPSYWIRVWIDPEHTREQFWIQFVPCAVMCVALLAWRIRAGSSWNWARAMPLVVAVSFLATPYGGWIFDLPVLLVPVVWCATRLANADRWGLLAAFLVGQIAVTAVSFATPGALQNYIWVAPTSLALCLLGLAGRQRSDPQITQRTQI